MNSTINERRAIARTTSLRLIRLHEVLSMCGLSRSSIYAAIKEERFPRPVAVGGRARAWICHEVEAWVAERVRASRNADASPKPFGQPYEGHA